MIRAVCIFAVLLVVILPHKLMASPPGETHVYGVAVLLTNGERLDGYIETNRELYVCNESKDHRTTWKLTWESFLEKQREAIHSGRTLVDTVKFMNELIEIRYNDTSQPFAAESSVREIRVDDIRGIDAVCRKWDGHVTVQGVRTITDYMAKYISNHKLISLSVYDEAAPSEAGKLSKEDCGLCSCVTTYLSYNPAYTQRRLSKQRKKIDEMPNGTLDRERLIRFTECWD